MRTKAPVGHAKKERKQVVCHRVGSHAMGSEWHFTGGQAGALQLDPPLLRCY